MPGFPIRTPWDHSPVIDSPRLIADSYVLLRLLMPRHPPCALKNLTTKDQKTNFRENHENQPHPTTTPPKGHHHHAQPDPGSYSWKLLLIKDARVHYVVLKQQPRTTHPTHQPPQRKPDRVIGAARKPETNVPRHTPQKGANPQSCCLRTQQCAKHCPATTHRHAFLNTVPPKGKNKRPY